MASHSEVAHRWAQDDPTARPLKGFNMFFERRPAYRGDFEDNSEENIIFSYGYHFPIAAFQTTPRGERVVLFNPESRSVSTSKHQSHVRRAIPPRYPVFVVPNPSPRYQPGGSENFHRDNLNAILERAAEAQRKSKRARVHKAFLLEQATEALNMADQYAAAFDLEWERPDDLDEIVATLEKRKAEAEAQYRKERAEREERERVRLAALHEEQRADFEAWQRGEGSRIPSTWRTDENGNAYVRRYRSRHSTVDNGIEADAPDELQTSMGASVPWRHALKAFAFIKLCRERGEAWKRNGRTIRVGHYQIDAIDAEGNMQAGCHMFAWEAMKALAEREGVYDVAPSADVVEAK